MSSAALSSPRASVNKTAGRGTYSMRTACLLLALCSAFNPAGQYGGRVFLGAVGAVHGARIVRRIRPLA